jgi:hypothetical protein
MNKLIVTEFYKAKMYKTYVKEAYGFSTTVPPLSKYFRVQKSLPSLNIVPYTSTFPL